MGEKRKRKYRTRERKTVNKLKMGIKGKEKKTLIGVKKSNSCTKRNQREE